MVEALVHLPWAGVLGKLGHDHGTEETIPQAARGEDVGLGEYVAPVVRGVDCVESGVDGVVPLHGMTKETGVSNLLKLIIHSLLPRSHVYQCVCVQVSG